MSAVCPYCRGPIDTASGESLECSGCGAPHHKDCYEENGGCTVFGCSAAPAEEAKLNLSAADLSAPVATPGDPLSVFAVGPASLAAGAPVKAPPPPPWATPTTPTAPAAPVPRPVLNSILFSAVPAPQAVAPPMDFDLTPDPNAKNRTTFILLGALLGALGAHNFYAGYRRKAAAQLCISLITLGFASPMSWVWALIDVFTVDRDSDGIRFRA